MTTNIATSLAPRSKTERTAAREAASTPAPITDAPDAARKARVPFGSHRQKLGYAGREGFHRHWFKDSIPGRIDAALEAGYEHVKDKQGRVVARVTGVAEGGGPETSFLMEIPEEFYKEDMAAQQADIDKTDFALKSGAIAGEVGQDGRYIPSTGIKIIRR